MKKIFLFSLTVLSIFSGFAQSENLVKFTAKISNRNSDTLVIRGANKFLQIIPIDAKGVFSASFEAPKGFYQIFDGKESSTLYLKPSSELNLTLDANEFDETIVYKGKGVNESNFLAQNALKEERFGKEAFSKEVNEFNVLFESKKKSDLEAIQKGDFDPEFKTKILNSIDNNNKYILQMYESVSKANKLVGKPSPDFNFENHKGGKTKLSDLKGKYVYIDVWATWCGPCRQEIPYLQKIEEKYEGKNIAFVSISIDVKKDYEKWKKLVTDKNLGGIQLLADNDWNSEFVVNYGITGIPRFILIGPDGNIVNSDAERPSDSLLQEKLDTLLQ